jgi:hypothetical protein
VQPRESGLEPISELTSSAPDLRKLDLALREVTLERREAALQRVERASALRRVPAIYFESGRSSQEEAWWAKQLGRKGSAGTSSPRARGAR